MFIFGGGLNEALLLQSAIGLALFVGLSLGLSMLAAWMVKKWRGRKHSE